MKLSRLVTVALVVWIAYKGLQTIRAVQSSQLLKPRDPFAPVN